jgi:hypothetical protein
MYGFDVPDYTVHIPEGSNLSMSFLMGRCRVHVCAWESVPTDIPTSNQFTDFVTFATDMIPLYDIFPSCVLV